METLATTTSANEEGPFQNEPPQAAADEGEKAVKSEPNLSADNTQNTENSIESNRNNQKDNDDNQPSADESGDDKRDPVFYEAGDEGKDFRLPLRLTKSGRKRATPFPMKLMKVLSDKDNAEIIAWTTSGKAFTILQPKVFCAKILPAEFKGAKYSSFTRKLHRWGFMRHYRGQDAGAFFHKHFEKGRMDLVEKMSCYKPVMPNNSPFSSDIPEPCPLDTSLGSGGSGIDRGSGGGSAVAEVAAPTFGNLGEGMLQPEVSDPTFANAMALTAGNMNMAMMLQQHAQQQQSAQNPFAMDGTQDLNAAIELEVTRRLKERINAAAMSRQMMIMPQSQQAISGSQQPQVSQPVSAAGLETMARSFIYPAQTNAALGANAGIPNFAGMQMQQQQHLQQQAQNLFGGAGFPPGTVFNPSLMNASGFQQFDAAGGLPQARFDASSLQSHQIPLQGPAPQSEKNTASSGKHS